MYACDGAGEAVDCFRRADAFDIVECPIEDNDLREGSDDGGEELNFEENAGWDRHV